MSTDSPFNYDVRAYTRTGIYSELVHADSYEEALRKASPALRKMAFGTILAFRVLHYE